LKSDILKLFRKYYLENDVDDNSGCITKHLVHNKSNWKPPKCENKALEESIDGLKHTPCYTVNQKTNLSFKKNAIDTLANDKFIFVKEVDIGGVVVIIDNDCYLMKNYMLKRKNVLMILPVIALIRLLKKMVIVAFLFLIFLLLIAWYLYIFTLLNEESFYKYYK